MTTAELEALRELRRLAGAVCWRCEGKGYTRRWTQARGAAVDTFTAVCPSCAGTGQPERVA